MKNEIIIGDCREVLKTLPDKSVHCCVTSPPYYGLRDYGVDGQIGLEQTPEEYVNGLAQVFREVKRVLRDDGTLWLNLGDSYGKNKQLLGIPWRVAFALQADGWILRSDIIWQKFNCMPESVTDRPTKAHEYIFLFSKSPKYYYDNEAIKEPCSENNIKDFIHRKTLNNKGTHGGTRVDLGRSREAYMPSDFRRNKRSVWQVNTKPYKGAHFAVFPPALVEPCIIAGCPVDGLVLDPFGGSGTVGEVCRNLNRHFILIELNPEYKKLIDARTLSNTPIISELV